MEKIQKVRGFEDITFDNAKKFRFISDVFRKHLEANNFHEIILPVLEFKDLYERSVGESSDIVQKEMFLLKDKKERVLAMRPEGTAGVVRAVLENNLLAHNSYLKLYYEGPMFRYERPQAGRYRQFHQIGAEVFGIDSPLIDAQIIKIGFDALKELGIELRLHINSIGCKECRPFYRESLKSFLEENKDYLCKDCLVRKDINPLRVLDCKVETCKELTKAAPNIQDFLCESCKAHQENLFKFLKAFNIEFFVDTSLVRGLDYYTRTVFEFVSLKSNITLLAGGRYDNLLKELGNIDSPAVGFACGVERIMNEISTLPHYKPLYFIIPMSEKELDFSLKVMDILLKENKRVDIDYRLKGFKKGLEFANKLNASYAILIGEEEVSKSSYILKDLSSKEQKIVHIL